MNVGTKTGKGKRVEKCETCGREFINRNWKKRHARFCSIKCFGESNKKWIVCRMCHEKVNRPQNKMFCSYKCAGVWRKGKKISEKHRINLCGPRPNIRNEGHHMWVGDKVGYGALHQWVYANLGAPMRCWKCGKIKKNNRQIHWSNRSGEYRREKSDWERLCVRCHKRRDLARGSGAKEIFLNYGKRRTTVA